MGSYRDISRVNFMDERFTRRDFLRKLGIVAIGAVLPPGLGVKPVEEVSKIKLSPPLEDFRQFIIPDFIKEEADRAKERNPQLFSQEIGRKRLEAVELPSEFSCSNVLPERARLQRTSDCAQVAATTILQAELALRNLEWKKGEPHWTLNPGFITLAKEQKVGTAMSFDDAAQILKERGVCRNNLPPPYEDISDWNQRPTLLQIEDAGNQRISQTEVLGYYPLFSLEETKSWIYQKGPIYLRFCVHDNFLNHQGGIIEPPRESSPLGIHAVVISGWSEEKKAFEIRNSWGDNWPFDGARGYTYFSYSCLSDPIFNYFPTVMYGLLPVKIEKKYAVNLPQVFNQSK